MDSSHTGGEIPGEPGMREIRARIPRMPLLPGHFAFRVVVLERDSGHVFFRKLGAVPLHVAGREKSRARGRELLCMDETWSMPKA